jgi:RNA polymerase sigma factor (sigma-70 family)
MKCQLPARKRPGNRRYVAAVVLGTALSALGAAAPSPVLADSSDISSVSQISGYCTVCWRNAGLTPDSWNDCTQEVFCRLLERVPTDCWDRTLSCDTEEQREFIRAIDTVKKRGQRARKWASDTTSLVVDGHAGRRQSIEQDREAVGEVATRLLSERQQRILDLCFEGYSIGEIGGKLNLPAQRVSDEKYKAICKLRSHFRAGEDAQEWSMPPTQPEPAANP